MLSLLLLNACVSAPPRTYLEYSGHITGCADMATFLYETNERQINRVFLDAMCMELYIKRLEKENIKHEIKRHIKSDVI